jgi:hypothetical protein
VGLGFKVEYLGYKAQGLPSAASTLAPAPQGRPTSGSAGPHT